MAEQERQRSFGLADFLPLAEMSANNPKSFRAKAARLRAEDLRIVASRYIANIERCGVFYRLPFDIGGWAEILHIASCRARQALNIYTPDAAVSDAPPSEVIDAYEGELIRQLDAYIRNYMQAIGGATFNGQIWATGLITAGFIAAFPGLQREAPHSQKFTTALNVLLEFVLLGTWTAYEAFIEDLWDAGLRVQPLRRPTKNNGNPVAYKAPNISVSIELYEQAFGATCPPLMDSVLLFELEQLRNLFAHQAGEVDRRFLNRLATRNPNSRLLQLAVGESVLLDGPMCRTYANESIRCAGNLLEEIDRLLVPLSP